MKKAVKVLLISCLCAAILLGCEDEPSQEQKEFEQEMDDLNKRIEKNQNDIDSLLNDISETSDQINSIGSDD